MLRRAFLSGLPAVAGLFAGPPEAQSSVSGGNPGPVHHAADDWLDDAPTKHRMVIDTWSPERFGDATLAARNWLRFNREAYGLTNDDLAILIVLRHNTAAFGLHITMWEKYWTMFPQGFSPGTAMGVRSSRTGSRRGLRAWPAKAFA